MIGKKLINTGGAAEATFTPSQHFDTVTYTGNGGTQRIGGYINRGAAFINGYITTPFDRQNIVNLNDKTEDFSISLWVNIAAYGSSNVIFSIDSGAPSYQYIGLVTTSTGVNWVHYPGGANGNTVVSSVNLNEWNHFACVRENSTMKLYKNGSLVGSDPITYANTSFGTGERIVIGKRTSVGDLPLNGKVDQFRVFDKALSSSEVTTLYGETAASTSKSVTDIFNDDSGVALYQLDGNANDTGGVSGKFGSGFVSSGESGDEYIELPDALSRNQSQTLSAWIYPVTQSTDIGTAIRLSEDDNMTISYNTSGQFEISGVRDSSDTYATFANVTKSANQWYHIAIARNASQIKLYIDGSLVETISWSGNLYSVGGQPYGNRIGQNNLASQNFTRKFAGKVDDVRVYSDELTLTEVGYIYNNTTASIPTDNLVAHYKLDGNALDETGIYSGTATNVIYAYDGTATNVTYQKATDFQPDLVWTKERAPQGFGHHLYDSVRGVYKALATQSTASEDTQTQGVQSFDTNGFTGGNWNQGNASGSTYVAWCFKGGGSAVTNTDGTITSQVSANQDAGFSIVKYTGNGVDNATIGHGLSSTPDLIIVKNLDSALDWGIWHSSLSTGQVLRFTTQEAQTPGTAYFKDGLNSSTVFGLGTNDETNFNTNNYIAYCFHSVEGYSKIGSYTGNGSASGPIVETGFEPAFLMVKNASGAGNWLMFDNERNTSNPLELNLDANNSEAEENNVNYRPSFLQNGFSIAGTSGGINTNGSTYIYLAIAADPDVTQPVVQNSFDVVTYTGNGSTQSIDTDFKPDLVWIKARNSTDFNLLFDSVRGYNFLSSNTTSAEDTSNVVTLSSYDTNGFTTGNDNGSINGVGDNYVAWCWKAGDHDDNLPQINTNGTIDSVVSVNAAAGFSIVKYTSSATLSDTIGHGLSSAPEMIIYKRTNTTSNWTVYTNVIDGSWDYLRLNLTDAKGDSADVWATASTIKNISTTGDWISYCFHSVDGYQKVGSYTGNGSATGPIITTGFQPRFLMVKKTDSADDWFMFDSVRSPINSRKLYIRANSSSAELDYGADFMNFITNGFQPVTTSNALNASGGNYIYLAIA